MKLYTLQTKYGLLRSDKPPKRYVLIYNFGAVFFGFFALACLCSPFLSSDCDIVVICMSIVGTLACSLAVWGYLFSKKKLLKMYEDFMAEVREEWEKEKAVERKYQQEHPFPKLEAFFQKACAAGISNLTSQADLSRLALFAKNEGITDPLDKIVEDFKVGKRYVEHHENKEKLDAVRKKEDELLKEYTRYSEYMDHEKSVAYCEDKIEEYRTLVAQYEAAENSASSTGTALYRAGKQQESSWAVHGGIASGIAGGAAGLAVAADVERRNQQKRQHNEELASATAALTAMQLTKIWERKRSAQGNLNYWNDRLEAAKLTLSEQQNEYEIIDMLHPTVKEYHVSETGAVHVSIALQACVLTIFGAVTAAADGSIKVIVKDGDAIVGEAITDLPYGGVRCDTVVNAICCNPSKCAQEYTFSFAPNYLWAVEIK